MIVEFIGAKDMFCDLVFPDGISQVHSALNVDMRYLAESYIEVASSIDSILDKVVVEQARACMKIKTMVKNYKPGKWPEF